MVWKTEWIKLVKIIVIDSGVAIASIGLNMGRSYESIGEKFKYGWVKTACKRYFFKFFSLYLFICSLLPYWWITIKDNNEYSINCMIMYAVHHGLAPSHITELMTSVAAQTSRPRLRSADTIRSIYVQSRIRMKFGERAFIPRQPCCMELATGWTLTNTDFQQLQMQPQDSSF